MRSVCFTNSAPLHLPRPRVYSSGLPWVPPNLLQSFKIVPVPRNHHRASGVRCEHDILTKSSAEILRRNPPTDSHFFNHLTSPPRSWSRCKQMCRFLGIYTKEQKYSAPCSSSSVPVFRVHHGIPCNLEKLGSPIRT